MPRRVRVLRVQRISEEATFLGVTGAINVTVLPQAREHSPVGSYTHGFSFRNSLELVVFRLVGGIRNRMQLVEPLVDRL